MTMSNSDARKRKAASDADLPATPGYIERLVRERDAARAALADAWDEGQQAGFRFYREQVPFAERDRNPYRRQP